MTRYAKLELEDSPGSGATTTAVYGTPFYLPATEVSFNPKPKPLDRSDEQRGIDGRLPVAENEYEPEGGINIRGYANYLGALLMVLFGDVTTTAGDGAITDPDGNTIPAGCNRHVFTKKSGVTPKTFRLTQSYGDVWLQVRGGTLKSLAFAIEEDGVKAVAEAMANYMSRLTADPADVPDYDSFSILPWRRRNVEVSHTGLATTKNLEQIEFTMSQELEYVRDLGDTSNSGFPSDTERANSFEGFLSLMGKLTRRDIDAVDWQALIAATEFDLKILLESEQNIGATVYPYRMWVQAGSCQFIDGEIEGQQNQPRHQHELDWQAGYNETDGYDFKVTLVNDAAYE